MEVDSPVISIDSDDEEDDTGLDRLTNNVSTPTRKGKSPPAKADTDKDKAGQMPARDLLATVKTPSKLKAKKSAWTLQGAVIADGVVQVQVPRNYELEAKTALSELLGRQCLALKEHLSDEQFQTAWKSIAKAFDAEWVNKRKVRSWTVRSWSFLR